MKKLNFLRQYFAETNKETFTRKEVLDAIEVFCEPLIKEDLKKEIINKIIKQLPEEKDGVFFTIGSCRDEFAHSNQAGGYNQCIKEVSDILNETVDCFDNKKWADICRNDKPTKNDPKLVVEYKTEKTFPSLTAKEIIEQCNNTVDGGKVLYDIDWYEDENFYTKEKCRPISMEFTELKHIGKSWNKCNELGKMFNFAEVVYLLEHNKNFREMLKENYIWTSSRASDGGLVRVGRFGAGGARVVRRAPDYSDGRLGVAFNK